MKKSKLTKNTLCPMCKKELNDDDGCFFDAMHDTKQCTWCNMLITYTKQLKRDKGNPYCDHVWHKTLFEYGA